MVNFTRRKFLSGMSTVAGMLGAIAAAIPFAKYFLPSARAKQLYGPLEVDISDIGPGEVKTILWRGKPIFILHRTPEMLGTLSGLEGRLKDPNSERSDQPTAAQNPHRSLDPEFLVLYANCTHLGCVPALKPKPGAFADVGSWWRGGFYCPCHRSAFDFSGRIYAGRLAPTNLRVPPYQFIGRRRILLGEVSGA